MESPKNSTSLEETTEEVEVEAIKTDEPPTDVSSKSASQEFNSQGSNIESPSELPDGVHGSPSKLSEEVHENPYELPEGVQYFPPTTADSSLSLQPSLGSQSRCSTSSLRRDALSCPKSRYLQDTLDRFGRVLPEQSRENLMKQLHEQELMREVTECVHLKRCTHTPTPHPPSGRRSPVNQQHHDQRMQKFNAKLKRQAFDRLADKIFSKLPQLVLQANITDLSQQAATTQRMINVIFSTICSYVGKPLTIHDHELYQHLSVGLARFIEDVIASVQHKTYSNESITGKEEKQHQQRSRGRCSMTTALLKDLSEADILRSSAIFKPITPKDDMVEEN